MRRTRIHIGVNCFGAGNIGDDLMMGGFLTALGPLTERAQLTCCTPHDIASQRLRFPQIDWRRDDPRTRSRTVRDADIWLGLGDTPFQIQSGTWMRDHLLQQVDLAREHAVPMFFLGVGVEDATVLDDEAYRDIANASSGIWTRDVMSSGFLEGCTTATVQTGADLSHVYLSDGNLPPIRDEMEFELGLLLAFEHADLRDAVKSILARLRTNRLAWLVQDVRDFSEREILGSIPAAQSSRFTPCVPDYRTRSVRQLLGSWPACKTVAASRYHGLAVMAWRGARLLAVRRSAKIASAAADLDVPLVDPSTLPEALEEARAVPRARLIELAENASTMVDDFCRKIGLGPIRARRLPKAVIAKLGRALSQRHSSGAERIAIVKCDSIGDFVLMTPFLRAVRKIWPHATVTLYVREAVAELANLCPYANRVITVSNNPAGRKDLLAAVVGEKRNRYDLVFVPRAATDHFQGLKIASMIGGHERRGFVGGSFYANARTLTHATAVPSARSHARINLALLSEFSDDPQDDRPELWPRQACVDTWRERMAVAMQGGRRLCLVGVGAQHHWKIWSPERFTEVVSAIVDRFGMFPVVVASEKEAELAEQIVRHFPANSLFKMVGYSLEDLCAIACLASLYVGNDTGPKHIAAAASVPVVEINPFPVNEMSLHELGPMYFHPHRVPFELLQPSGVPNAGAVFGGAAINAISANEVVSAIERLLSRAASPASTFEQRTVVS